MDIYQLIAQAQNLSCHLERANIKQGAGLHIHPAYLARILTLTVGDTEEKSQLILQLLYDIHTETTPSERRFLFSFFQKLWDGQNDVLEIGPFLGGSTRAIALGMLENPHRRPDARLYTYDRFGKYKKPEKLLHLLKPMFDRGVLAENEKRAILENDSFWEVFEIIHRHFEYYKIIVPQRAILMDIPPGEEKEDEATFRYEGDEATPFQLPSDSVYSAVFVDGCKSWYGTKQFMRTTVPHTPKGSYYLFQDYGTHTCFWLPIFIQIFKKHFKLVAYIDHTYTFELVEELTPEAIDQNFPDSPKDLNREDYELLFKQLLADSILHNDVYTVFNYQLQHAGAIAYLGYRDEARAKIVDMLNSPFALTHRSWIMSALEYPTYDAHRQNVDLFLPKKQ